MAELVAEILSAEESTRYVLLAPGRVALSPAVEGALTSYDPRQASTSAHELLPSLTDKLQQIFRATPQHTVALFDGGSAAAIECAIASTVPRDSKILIIDNGARGEHLYAMAERYGIGIVHLRYAWGDLVEPGDVERALELHADIAVVAMVHHEASVGLLNPVAEIGALCRRFDVLLAVDAASSLGAEDIDVTRDNIDICTSGADEYLHSIGGVSILCVSPRVWPKIETIKARSYSLDLKRHRRETSIPTPAALTPIAIAYFALEAACTELLAEGLQARFATYRRRNRQLRDGLAELGMAPLTRTGRESCSVVTSCVPQGMTFYQLHLELHCRGYIIGSCSDVLADTFLQVANTGYLDERDIDEFLAALSEIVASARSQLSIASAPVAPGSRHTRPAA